MRKTGLATAALVGLGMALAGCGGREAKPVAITNPADSAFNCAGISREFAANESQILRQILVAVKGQAHAQIQAEGKESMFVFRAMDPKSPEKVEIDALRNRNKVLEDIARTKRCSQPKSQLTEIYKKLDNPGSAKPAKVKD